MKDMFIAPERKPKNNGFFDCTDALKGVELKGPW
jgi:hypothetical protein